MDFTAAGLFVVGSALFFFASTAYVATWMFLIGSIFFGMKPTIRLMREIRFVRMGRYEALEQEAVLVSLENLMTFPFVQEALEAGDLTLHGLWMELGEGGLEQYDAALGQFAAV